MMNKRKLAIAIGIILALILTYNCLGLRFLIIRVTVDSDLPAWFKSILWGWI